MFIKEIELKNFRNHKNTFVKFSPGTNILLGANAQGKTNLLEAIYLTAIGRGWRASKDKEMITFGEGSSTIITKTQKRFGTLEINIKLNEKSKKSISINKLPISKVGELMGNVNCVFFSPNELRMIKDAPADRRRFLDIDISQIDKAYFYALLRYEKILSQRNAFLKNISTEDDIRSLEIWDKQLIDVGAFIIEKRISFINKLSPLIVIAHNKLTNSQENITFSYVCVCIGNKEKVINISTNIIDTLKFQLNNARENDIRLKTTTIGPHRDDIKIEINGNDVRRFGSQGQQRTASLSIKLAELKLFELETGETPILLLDDVFSELDETRQTSLLNYIQSVHSIITTTELPKTCFPDNYNIIRLPLYSQQTHQKRH
ncbi:MAG: DNA replication/repair protein RecF [Christensenellaceae bacterium]|jgi:DNA replication and repair protein RecF|nr:DNA replication/repair protein RecF [Christensenellaceae bacterium]